MVSLASVFLMILNLSDLNVLLCLLSLQCIQQQFLQTTHLYFFLPFVWKCGRPPAVPCADGDPCWSHRVLPVKRNKRLNRETWWRWCVPVTRGPWTPLHPSASGTEKKAACTNTRANCATEMSEAPIKVLKNRSHHLTQRVKKTFF